MYHTRRGRSTLAWICVRVLQLQLLVAIHSGCMRVVEASSSSCTVDTGWGATVGTKEEETARTAAARAPGGYSMIHKTEDFESRPRLVPSGFKSTAWDVTGMCGKLFGLVETNPNAVCGAIIATGVVSTSEVGYDAGPKDDYTKYYGMNATVDCRGGPNPSDELSPEFVVLSLCSSTCMLDQKKTCCKVPKRFASRFPCCRENCCCPDQKAAGPGGSCVPKSASKPACRDHKNCPRHIRFKAASMGRVPNVVAWCQQKEIRASCLKSCGVCTKPGAPACADAPYSGMHNNNVDSGVHETFGEGRRMLCTEAVQKFTCDHPEYGAFLHFMCRKTCGTCGACLDYAHSGFRNPLTKQMFGCAEYAAAFGCDHPPTKRLGQVRAYCPKTCGLCSGTTPPEKPCADWKHSHLFSPANDGKFESCGNVADLCFAAEKRVDSYRLRKYCPKTCGQCGTAACADSKSSGIVDKGTGAGLPCVKAAYPIEVGTTDSTTVIPCSDAKMGPAVRDNCPKACGVCQANKAGGTAPSPASCTGVRHQPNVFCGGVYDVDKKKLAKSASRAACAAQVQAEASCGNIYYFSPSNSLCSCVLRGKACVETPTTPGVVTYNLPCIACKDSERSGLIDPATHKAYSCKALAPYCSHAQHGPTLRSKCPHTCGTCGCQNVKTTGITDKATNAAYSCTQMKAHCQSKAQVGTYLRAKCPRTCETCAKPITITTTPAGNVGGTSNFDGNDASGDEGGTCMDSKSSGFVNKNTKVPYSCSAVASLCNNAKFAVQLEKACPKTCKICGRRRRAQLEPAAVNQAQGIAVAVSVSVEENTASRTVYASLLACLAINSAKLCMNSTATGHK